MNDSSRVKILLVDDQPAKLLSYETILESLGEILIRANSAAEAFQHLLKNDIAVLLLDAFMPDLDGFELAKMVRDHPRFQSTSIIFISAVMMTDIDFLKGYQCGAVDYVSVPVVPEILRAKVKVFAELHRKTRQLEQLNATLEARVQERTRELELSNAAVRRNEERLRLAFAAAELGWWEVDRENDTVACSPTLAESLGLDLSGGTVSLRRFKECIYPDDLGTFEDFLRTEASPTSHHCELRFVRGDGSPRWSMLAGRSIGGEAEGAHGFTGINLDISARKMAEDRLVTLLYELDHRAKNLLAVVQSVMHLTRAETLAEFRTAVDGRLRALRTAHSLLSESRWQAVDLGRIIAEETGPFAGGPEGRLRIGGPSALLPPAIAQALALVIHELATNSTKYGALSTPHGSLSIAWDKTPDLLRLEWVESGGPPVAAPSRHGFGTKLIAATINDQLKGEAGFDWRADGLRCILTVPMHAASRSRAMAAAPPILRVAAEPPVHQAQSILLVEDEALVSLMMQEEFKRHGWNVVGPYRSFDDAISAAREAQFDAAVLDLNLNGVSSYPIADVLQSRGISYAFLTGYSRDRIDPRYRHVFVLEKPIGEEGIRAVIDHVRRAPAAASQ